jgi:hypothetical protein
MSRRVKHAPPWFDWLGWLEASLSHWWKGVGNAPKLHNTPVRNTFQIAQSGMRRRT